MPLSTYAVQHRAVILFSMALLFAGGLYAYGRLGKLEDPEFTIKTAMIVTRYPGASPLEVEQQVTDEIEKKVQELETLDQVRSISKAGVSIVYVDILESFRKKDMPQIWDKLRRKIHDVEPFLPPGTELPEIYDDYGDVYGVFLALTGEGFTYAELKDYAVFLQKEIVLVKDVNRVEIWGDRIECVYLEISTARLAELGIPARFVISRLQDQNLIVDAGRINVGTERIRLEPAGAFNSLEDIKKVVIRGSPPDELVLLEDVAEVVRGYLEPPERLMRYNGKPAIGLAISTVSKGNVVVMGDAVKRRLAALMHQLPVGLDIGPISYQGITVRNAIRQFVLNLIEALAIVIGILLITMGIRSGLLIGVALLQAIIGTFVVMLFWGIDLQRASLGALIIAMGMLVDNAIVVTEGSLIRLQKGDDRTTAATLPARETAWPLLGATLVAILAFLPVYLARNNTGEYCESIFLVVGISLGLSWIIAMTLTPVLCWLFLKVPPEKVGSDPYSGAFYRNYRFVLEKALHHRMITIAAMILLLVFSVYGFGFVEKNFFPNSELEKFMIEYWLPEGSRFHDVSEDLGKIEHHLMQYEEILNITSCVGSGVPRFILEYEPAIPNTSYGLVLINVSSTEDIDRLQPQIEYYLKKNFPQAEPRVRRFPLGPFVPFKVEARISGPDPVVLRDLADRAKNIMRADPDTKDTRDNWRQRVKVLRPAYSQQRGRRASVGRHDLARALAAATDGSPVGLYREGDELLPIMMKLPKEETHDSLEIMSVPVQGETTDSLPLGQIAPRIKLAWEDPIIHRYNRRRTITAQTQPHEDKTATKVISRIKSKIETIPLPPGYYLEWGGEYEQDTESNEAVFAPLPLVLIFMTLIVVTLFNAFRQPLIILMILPLAMIGVTAGLLITDQPFGFMALLGGLSLFGMLIKNAVVLLDQINIELARGTETYTAVVISSVSRLRPVMMASFTTVLGMTPLLTDRLFGAMAVAIMFGLSFGTVLTLVVVPVLYTMLFRVQTR